METSATIKSVDIEKIQSNKTVEMLVNFKKHRNVMYVDYGKIVVSQKGGDKYDSVIWNFPMRAKDFLDFDKRSAHLAMERRTHRFSSNNRMDHFEHMIRYEGFYDKPQVIVYEVKDYEEALDYLEKKKCDFIFFLRKS